LGGGRLLGRRGVRDTSDTGETLAKGKGSVIPYSKGRLVEKNV